MLQRGTTVVALALVLGVASSEVSTASAQTHDRNFFVGVGPGFGIGFDSGAYFRAEQHLGYHFLNVDQHPGLYAGVAFVEGFQNFIHFNIAGMIGFDILVWQNAKFAVLINPSLQLGPGFHFNNGNTFPYFYMHPGVEVGFALLEGLLNVWWRPLAFDIWIRDGGGAAYTQSVGVNLNF